MADPTDIFAYDELVKILKRQLRLAVVRESELLRTVDACYRKTEEISSLAEELSEELSEADFNLANLAETSDVAEAPVVKLLQSLFEDAVQMGASDVHIEPDESVVMRLLDQSDGVLDLARIGMPESILARFRRNIAKPHGMVLVTGPTGSGKTTTLYGALTALNSAERKIITVEDPVEYHLPRSTRSR